MSEDWGRSGHGRAIPCRDAVGRQLHWVVRPGYGVTLKSITDPFDTANAAGKMMLQMLGVFAEFEHASIVERTKVGTEKMAKARIERCFEAGTLKPELCNEAAGTSPARPEGALRPGGQLRESDGGGDQPTKEAPPPPAGGEGARS